MKKKTESKPCTRPSTDLVSEAASHIDKAIRLLDSISDDSSVYGVNVVSRDENGLIKEIHLTRKPIH